jgi:hypothetical protein
MRRSGPGDAADDVAGTEPAKPGVRSCILTAPCFASGPFLRYLNRCPDGITASAIHPSRWVQRWHSGSPDFQNSVTPFIDRNWLVSIGSLETH